MDASVALLLTAGGCSLGAVLISARLIRRHLNHWSKPEVQSKIVGIVWMVPIYAVDSWLSLCFPDAAIFLDVLRDCYESYVLYLFLALMISYLGDGDEAKVLRVVSEQPQRHHLWPFDLCFRDPLPRGAAFVRWCKKGTLQYSIIKPASALVAICLEATDVYRDASFSPSYGYLYLCIIVNASITYAVYVLTMFYLALHEPLEPHRPVPKFLCIKAVIFFSFWQSIVINALDSFGLLSGFGIYDDESISTVLQDLLICVEMFIASIALSWAFPNTPYRSLPASMRAGLLDDHFAHNAAVRDFNQVMPVLLPSRFRPGKPVTTTRLPSTYRRLDSDQPEVSDGEGGTADRESRARLDEMYADYRRRRGAQPRDEEAEGGVAEAVPQQGAGSLGAAAVEMTAGTGSTAAARTPSRRDAGPAK